MALSSTVMTPTTRLRHIKATTVIVPADTPSTTPIFLSVRQETLCDSFQRGCQKVGLETKVLPADQLTSYQHADTYVMNDPDKYTGADGTLCRDDLVGCGEYKSGNNVTYFKDPAVTGGALCTYRAATNGSSDFGWFKNGVGQCSGNAAQLCKTSTDCGAGNVCNNVGNVPCYSNNLSRGGEHGIWSNESANYAGFVGQCEAQFNACTELLDVGDTSNLYPKGQPYHVIFDNTVTAATGQCRGKVSQKEGCVLFDQTDNPSKIYNAKETYADSQRQHDAFVAPESQTGPFDSNLILKVNRDRTCAEWLACRSSIPQRDPGTGGPVNLCYQYAACEGTTNGADCVNWVDRSKIVPGAENRLTEANYISRNTRWDGVEYSGYSLFDKHQINDLQYIAFNLSNYPSLQTDYGNNSYVVYTINDSVFATAGMSDKGCQQKLDWDICGFEGGGRCYNKRCVYPSSGLFRTSVDPHSEDGVRDALTTLDGGTCKAYPEEDSPYELGMVAFRPGSQLGMNVKRLEDRNPNSPSYQVKRIDIIQTNPAYEGTNFCQDGACSCEYNKVIYKSGNTDYWPFGTSYPNGVCSGGSFEGYPCDPKARLASGSVADRCSSGGGTCMDITDVQMRIGLSGYCLEDDLSRPLNGKREKYACASWLPVRVSASGVDVYNTDVSAGYDPARDADGGFGQVYCQDATRSGA
jgi:hypothetical protein